MKKIAGILFLAMLVIAPAISFGYTSPGKAVGQVNDFAKVLSAADVQTLESELDSFGLSTSISVVVATVPTLGNETIETYATKLFEEWGIGGAEKDLGVLLLVAPNEREVRIETGYGVEGDLTDLQANQVIENVMIPEFKKGDYATGIKNGARAVTAILVNSPDAEQYTSSNSDSDFNPLPFVFLFVIVINILAKFLGKTKSWWLGGVLGAVIGVVIGLVFGLVIGLVGGVILTIIGLIFDYLVSKHPPGSGGSGGFWPMFLGGGHGGSSGGFGGFGGGMSGGGGSSGRW